jgi:PAS domain S-box-containing protein
MKNRIQNFYLLAATMGLVVVVVSGIIIYLLYQTALEQKKTALLDTVQYQSRLMEAVAEFDRKYSAKTHPQGSFGATLSQIEDALNAYEFRGETEEFLVARLQDGRIRFLFDRGRKLPGEIPPVHDNGARAQAMNRALRGESGVDVLIDYRGDRVLAAYAPVPALSLGIVHKIDMAEIQAPFLRAGRTAALASLLIVLLGVFLQFRINSPLLRKIEDTETERDALIAGATDGILGINQNGIITSFNRAAERLFGYRESEIIGKSISLLLPPTLGNPDSPVPNFSWDTNTAATTVNRELAARHRDGALLAVELTLSGVESGDRRQFTGIVRDLTDQRNIELALQESDTRFRTLVQASPVGVFETDADGYCTYVNDKWCGIAGMSCDSAMGDGWIRAIHPEDREWLTQAWQSAITSNDPFKGEYRIQHADSRTTWVYGQAVAVKSGDGHTTGFVGTITDITPIVQAEHALQISEQSYHSVISAMSEGVLVQGRDRTIHTCNPSAEKILGVSAGSVIGRQSLGPHFRAVCEDGTSFPQDGMPGPHTLVTGIPLNNIIMSVLRPDNRVVWLSVSTRPITLAGESEPHAVVTSFLDITDKRNADTELRAGQRQLQDILNSMTSFVGMFDTDGTVLEVNRAPLDAAGLTRAEVVGKNFADAWWWTWSQEATEEIAGIIRRVAAGETLRRDLKARVAQDRYIITDTTFSPLLDSEGKVFRIVASAIDITERKAAEETLRRSESSLSAAQRIAHVGNWTWNIESGEILWADEVFRIFGHAPQEFLPTYNRFLGSIHPDDRQKVTDAVNQSVADHTPYSVDHRIIRQDGSERTVREEGEASYDAAGKPLTMIGTVQDITEYKNIESRLKSANDDLERRVSVRTKEVIQERNFISAVLETVGALIVVLDSHGHIVGFNRACEKITGYTFGEVRDSAIWNVLIPKEDVAAVRQIFSGHAAGSPASQHENHWITKSGQRRLISWSNSTITDGDGKVRIIGTGIDITERKRAELALIKSKEEAEHANTAKSAFLSRMSHELRTPMNAILGFGQILDADSKHPLTPDQQEGVSEILKAGYHLLDLINEVLDLSRIEAGKMALAIEPVSVRQIIDQAAHMVTPLIRQRSIKLLNRTAKSRDLAVMADKTRLKQVLVNLLSNAAKYNVDNGRIMITCDELPNDRARISVTDTGPGIAADKLASLFVPFERLGAEFTEIEGTGIGLALSKHLVDMMDGAIGVGSTPGQGTTFWLELKTMAIPARTGKTTDPGRAQQDMGIEGKIRVLYVEDNPSNLKLVASILSRYENFILLSAGTGELGVDLARAHRPEIILMDIHLPGISGYEALDILRKHEETSAIPVIALSADAMPHDIKRGLEAGFHRYLTKPLKLNELMEAMDSAVNRTEA